MLRAALQFAKRPSERKNLWLQYPERVATLSRILEQIQLAPRTRP